MGSRQNAQREWQLLGWWLAQVHPLFSELWMNVRVGPTEVLPGAPTTQAFLNMARVRNRWADALFYENGALNLVEAKMEPDPGIYSTLIHYARKLRMDPKFTQFANAPLNLIALVARDDPSVGMEAPWYGVQWVVYQPSFLTEQQTITTGNSAGGPAPPLPQDWLTRVSLLTGKPVAGIS